MCIHLLSSKWLVYGCYSWSWPVCMCCSVLCRYYSSTGHLAGFRARPVIGGLYAQMLVKRSSRPVTLLWLQWCVHVQSYIPYKGLLYLCCHFQISNCTCAQDKVCIIDITLSLSFTKAWQEQNKSIKECIPRGFFSCYNMLHRLLVVKAQSICAYTCQSFGTEIACMECRCNTYYTSNKLPHYSSSSPSFNTFLSGYQSSWDYIGGQTA